MRYVFILLTLWNASGWCQTKSEYDETFVRSKAYKIALEHKLDPHLFIAIIDLESAFKVGAYNPRTKDYGLGQINLENIKALKLNRRRLLHDPEYNLKASADILSYMHTKYGHERDWYCRYNVGLGHLKGYRKKTCLKYAWLVQQRLSNTLIVAERSKYVD